jgi:deazaflavin-dependent oxidoreductase (nitroreductase family)
MPLPHALARFNGVVTNRITGRFAGWLPGFAIVVHRGRVSGRAYHTPVNAFRRRGGGWVLALTYGPDAQWVRNLLAEGRGGLVAGGRLHQVVGPRLVRDPRRRQVPPPVRLVLRLIAVDYFLELDEG